MNLSYLFDGANWGGSSGIGFRILQHIGFSVVGMALALVVALPIGIAAGHTGRFGFLAINVSNVGRAVPSLAFLALFSELIPRGFSSVWPTIIALFALAVPPLVTNTYVGMRQADADAVEAAKGVGMSPLQVALRVQFPLALPLAVAGARTSTTNVIATVAIAALVSQGGLGRLIIDGEATQNTSMEVAGALLVAALAIIADIALALLAARLSAVARSRRVGSMRATREPAVAAEPV